MNNIKYLLQYLGIIFLFFIYKILGIKMSSTISGYIFWLFGPIFRSNKLAEKNLIKALPDSSITKRKKILKEMWFNYGKIFSEYMYLKNFRKSQAFEKKIFIENQYILEEIKKNQEPVIFISGHFNNFELMAMHIEKSGINLAAIYRPLNNIFLNPIMESLRKNFICKIQIKKGISGTKTLLKQFKNKTSIALMIDQRVSEGIKSKFFNEDALTTTIPAQFVKKFRTKIIPIHIERLKNNNFKLKIFNPIKFKEDDSIESITLHLNKVL